MNRIYQGRVSKAEMFGGKDAEGKEQWNLVGFTREKLEQFQKEREHLQQLAKKESPQGIDARKELKGRRTAIQPALANGVVGTSSMLSRCDQLLYFSTGVIG